MLKELDLCPIPSSTHFKRNKLPDYPTGTSQRPPWWKSESSGITSGRSTGNHR